MRPFSAAALVFALSASLMAQAPENSGQRRRRPADRPAPAQMDTDGDGRISSSEWKRRPEAFARLDSNNDGYITRDELSQIRGQRGNKGDRGDRAPRAMDTNNDGKIGRDEWKGQSEVFDRLDANHDGFITRDERPKAKRRPQ